MPHHDLYGCNYRCQICQREIFAKDYQLPDGWETSPDRKGQTCSNVCRLEALFTYVKITPKHFAKLLGRSWAMKILDTTPESEDQLPMESKEEK